MVCGVRHDVPAAAHKEIATERRHVAQAIDEQHTRQADAVVDESHDRTGDKPSALHAGHQERVRLHELGFRCQLLNERRDRRPEHPETGSNERVHHVELPDLDLMAQCERGHDEDDDKTARIEQHDEPAAVFTVDDDAGERQHQDRGDRRQHDQRAQRRLIVRGLQDVPDHGGVIHPAPQHGDEIGGKHQPQRPLLKDGTHAFWNGGREPPAGASSTLLADDGFSKPRVRIVAP